MDGPISVLSHLCQTNSRKRPHEHISGDSRGPPPPLWVDAEGAPIDTPDPPSTTTSSAGNFALSGLRMPSTRFRGDGLDMRRPIMSTQPIRNVIDLTEDSPTATSIGNQPGHISRGMSRQADARLDEPSFLHTSNNIQSRRRANQHGYSANIGNNNSNNTVDLRESSPEVQFIEARPRSRSRSNHGPADAPDRLGTTPAISGRLGTHLGFLWPPRDQVVRQLPEFAQYLRTIPTRVPFQSRDELVAINDRDTRGFEPVEMNFGMLGFNLQNPSAPIHQPRLPTYEAPPAPRDGYTRDLKEDDMLVCPNCDDELGVGDSDIKKQVWIIKSCGHVYCGECTKYRAKSKRSPPHKGAPFTKCVVPDCSKNISSKTMIQIYL